MKTYTKIGTGFKASGCQTVTTTHLPATFRAAQVDILHRAGPGALSDFLSFIGRDEQCRLAIEAALGLFNAVPPAFLPEILSRTYREPTCNKRAATDRPFTPVNPGAAVPRLH